jgi:hypothetical protein
MPLLGQTQAGLRHFATDRDERRKGKMAMRAVLLTAIALAVLASPIFGYTISTVADSDTSYTDPDLNYGTLTSVWVEPDPYLHYGWWKFDTAGIKAQFDGLYGVGQWTISGVTFNASYYRHSYVSSAGEISAGYGVDDSWTETGITWNNQPGGVMLLDTVSVVVPAPGTSVLATWDFGTYDALINDIMNGEMVTVCAQSVGPTGGGGAAFDSREWLSGQNAAYMDVSVATVPEPVCLLKLTALLSTAGILFRRRPR